MCCTCSRLGYVCALVDTVCGGEFYFYFYFLRFRFARCGDVLAINGLYGDKDYSISPYEYSYSTVTGCIISFDWLAAGACSKDYLMQFFFFFFFWTGFDGVSSTPTVPYSSAAYSQQYRTCTVLYSSYKPWLRVRLFYKYGTVEAVPGRGNPLVVEVSQIILTSRLILVLVRYCRGSRGGGDEGFDLGAPRFDCGPTAHAFFSMEIAFRIQAARQQPRRISSREDGKLSREAMGGTARHPGRLPCRA